jgi:hypothetical protein
MADVRPITPVHRRGVALMPLCLVGLVLGGGCQRKTESARCGDGAETLDESDANRAAFRAHKRCIVHLHGKGSEGAPSALRRGGVKHVCPSGNAPGWGHKQWRYFPDAGYREVRDAVTVALDAGGCAEALVHGFSNGAAAAAKLFCRGESFEGRMRGYIVDDPVPDHGADACTPAPGVRVALYWSGALTQPVAGWKCATLDWTCEGGSSVGIDAFARSMSTSIQRSPERAHRPYAAPPEHTGWW